MLTKERIIYLLDRLDRDRIIHVKEIAAELDVSESTIRRDLTELENQGKLKRVHGGAIKGNGNDIVSEHREMKLQENIQSCSEEKRALCKAASDLVEDGECIFIDGGADLVCMIEYLQERPLRIVTNNHRIVARLNNPKAKVIVIGGDYLARDAMSSGTMALNEIRQFQFDRCFISCAGLDIARQMTYTSDMETREIKEMVMNNSRVSYLLTEGSKVLSGGFCKFEPVSRFDSIFITAKDKLPVLPSNFKVIALQ
jgi:DeoR family fructose operon transcriptional repressor